MIGVGVEFRLKLPKRGTSAKMTVFVAEEAVWPAPSAPEVAMDFSMDDLLSYLFENWAPLALRQTYPIPVSTMRPFDLRSHAERRWDEQTPEVAEREDAALCDFEDSHDLSRCFSGYFDLPSLWLLRRGDKMIVDTRAGFKTVGFNAALRELTRVGDEIAKHLAAQDKHWSPIVKLWKERELTPAPMSMLALSVGLPRPAAERLAQEGVLTAPTNFRDAANDDDELRIAARMAGPLPPEEIRAILKLAATFPAIPAPELEAMAKEISGLITERYAGRRPHVQGELAAGAVRGRLGLGPSETCDIAQTLMDLGVRLEHRSVKPAELRALAIDGRCHGPAVFVNLGAPGRKRDADPHTQPSVRIDLAHEFCHLLLDRGHALAAVDILNSRMPVEIEQRAKSFAGELLAPTEAVGGIWREAGSPRSLNALTELVDRVQNAFNVTRAVACWKLQHATQKLDADLSRLLDQIAPER